MVGRFARISQASEFANNIWVPDIKWCKENGKDYLPVVWPGFSVHNLLAQKPFNEIPRHSGRFLWEQFTQAKMVGAKMVYVAMFDELDEATAIFKCTNKPPIGPSSFLKYDEGNAEQPDHYLCPRISPRENSNRHFDGVETPSGWSRKSLILDGTGRFTLE